MEYLSFEFDNVSRLKFFIGFSSLIKDFHMRGDNREYTILRVDLTGLIGKKIHIYQDELAEEGAVYTYEPIPPQCISVYKVIGQ